MRPLSAALVVGALAGGAWAASSPAAELGTAKAKVVLRGKPYAFTGGACTQEVLGLSVGFGSQEKALLSAKATAFELSYTQSRKTGTYKVKGTGTVVLVVNRKLIGMSTFTLKLKQNGKSGTFAGTLTPSYGGGTLSGAFTC